jgi:predicted RNase H-like HicB family nuclease
MKVELGKEKDGYHAKIAGRKHLVAFGFTRAEALEELLGVVEAELQDEAEVRQIEQKIQEQLNRLAQDD